MRIALVSDIHFGKLSTTKELALNEDLETGTTENSKPLFGGLKEILRTETPDYLFIAGDLTSTGSPLEFKYCYSKICQLAEHADVSMDRIVVCLGNHDVDWRITEIVDKYNPRPETAADTEYLQNIYREAAQTWSIQRDGFGNSVFTNFQYKHNTPLTGIREFDDCIIFVLNSSHLCSNDQVYKHGCLDTAQLEWLRTTARNYAPTQKAKFILLHHHPFNYPYPLIGLDISTLEEGSELLQLCGEVGIDLVLHGHRHHPNAKTKKENEWTKQVTFICSGSLSVNASHRLSGSIPNTFHLIDYNNSDNIILKTYYYSPSNGWLLYNKSDDSVPVDGKMTLGKIVDDTDAIELIRQFPIDQRIEYENLNGDLFYLSLNRLNNLVKQVFSADYEIYDEFPKAIRIVARP